MRNIYLHTNEILKSFRNNIFYTKRKVTNYDLGGQISLLKNECNPVMLELTEI